MLFHKGRELYGLYEARQALRQIDRLVVVEGYMDVVALARHGIDFSIATLGTATTDEHLNRLFRLTENIDFCFDGDRAGQQAALARAGDALPQMREGRQVRFVFLPEGHDPDSYVNEHGADAFIEALDNGVPLSDFLIGELARQVDMDTVDGRARLAELARPLIAQDSAGRLSRACCSNRLAQTVGLTAAKLERMIGDADRPTEPATPSQAAAAWPAAQAGKPSVVRRAITLLLNHPAGSGQARRRETGRA